MWLLCSGAFVFAQEAGLSGEAEPEEEPEEEQKKEEAIEKDRYRLLPMPIFITEPAIGEGLGVALALFHPVKGGKKEDQKLATLDSIDDFAHSREAPPVVTGVAGAYTNSRTWAAGVGHSNNWKNDSVRYTGALGAARVNSKIYVANLPLTFSMETTLIFQEMKFRVAGSNFMLGAAFSYMDASNEFGVGQSQSPGSSLVLGDFKNIGFAGEAAYETRDNTMNPHSGQLIELSLWRYDESIGGDYDYWSSSLKALSFHPLTEKFTLGLRLEVSGVDGDVPFFAYPFVKLRGIPALRYQNKKAGAFEAELRYLLAPRWEVSAFAGLGQTSDDIPFFENPDSIYNFGVGGRFNIFRAHNVWVGLDVARGPEDWNWYIQVGHPW
jgi:hypothetical protein